MAGGKKFVTFSERQATEMAQYVAELERQGIAYVVDDIIGGWNITITGF
jgi:hypothetical protein